MIKYLIYSILFFIATTAFAQTQNAQPGYTIDFTNLSNYSNPTGATVYPWDIGEYIGPHSAYVPPYYSDIVTASGKCYIYTLQDSSCAYILGDGVGIEDTGATKNITDASVHLFAPGAITGYYQAGMFTVDTLTVDNSCTVNVVGATLISTSSNNYERIYQITGSNADVSVHCQNPLWNFFVSGTGVYQTSMTVGNMANANLSLGKMIFPGSQQEADLLYSTAPGATMTVRVPVTATGVSSTDTRSAKISLTWPNQQGGPLVQMVPLSNLANGATYSADFGAIFLPTDAGDKQLTATIEATDGATDINFSNNIVTGTIHVLCDVQVVKAKEVPFHFQQESHPTNIFGPYGEFDSPIHTLGSFGCYLSDIAMWLNFNNFNQTASVNVPIGAGEAFKIGTLIPLDQVSLNDASRYVTENGVPILFDRNNNPISLNIVNYARMSWGAQCASGNASTLSCSSLMPSQISFKPDQMTYNLNTVQKNICNGNPVTLELDIPQTVKIDPKTGKSVVVKEHSHFVLATAMSVDASGKPSYIINDPGKNKNNGQQKKLFNLYSTNAILGQRLFVPASDPSFLRVDLTSQNAEFVVTDPQGRRAGFNPLIGQKFNEIPGATYSKEFSPNENPDDMATDELTSTILTISNSGTGSYTIDIYGTANGTAEYEISSYDINGYITDTTPISQAITKGGHVQSSYSHSDQPVISVQTNIEKADFFEHKNNHSDRIALRGKFVLGDGQSIKMQKGLSLSLGNYSKMISVGDFWKKTTKQKTEYRYQKNGVYVKLNSTGEFKIVVDNSGLTSESMHSAQFVTLKVDNVFSTSLETFKIFDKHHKDYDRECHHHDYDKGGR